ncbi:hypothetical protein HanIR_Chr17g0877371 [Helianthus annuus]|nr:hypothetical protein HanIR_Chr17g0877371 [Helianthus annuus]
MVVMFIAMMVASLLLKFSQTSRFNKGEVSIVDIATTTTTNVLQYVRHSAKVISTKEKPSP